MRIILDAMGGDHAPQAPVMGTIQAANTHRPKNKPHIVYEHQLKMDQRRTCKHVKLTEKLRGRIPWDLRAQ